MKWLAVIAAGIAHFVLGGIWFGAVVAKHYPLALGIADRPPTTSGALFFVGPLVCSVVTIAASAVLLRTLGIVSYGGAIGFGTLIGLGYLTPMTLNIAINPLFPRPFYYLAINAPYFVAGSILACVILVALS